MHRIVVAALGVLLPVALQSQETRTVCRDVGSRTICDTKPKEKERGGPAWLAAITAGLESLDSSRARQPQVRRDYEADTLAFNLYARRAVAVLWDTIEDMGLDSTLSKGFVREAKPVILDLYRVNPKATNSEIVDAFYPLVRKYRNKQ